MHKGFRRSKYKLNKIRVKSAGIRSQPAPFSPSQRCTTNAETSGAKQTSKKGQMQQHWELAAAKPCYTASSASPPLHGPNKGSLLHTGAPTRVLLEITEALLSWWSPPVFFSVQAKVTYRPTTNGWIQESALGLRENGTGCVSINLLLRHVQACNSTGKCRKPEKETEDEKVHRKVFQMCYSTFWDFVHFGLFRFCCWWFCYFTAKHSFDLLLEQRTSFRAPKPPEAPSLITTYAQPIFPKARRCDFIYLWPGECFPTPQGCVLSPSSDYFGQFSFFFFPSLWAVTPTLYGERQRAFTALRKPFTWRQLERLSVRLALFTLGWVLCKARAWSPFPHRSKQLMRARWKRERKYLSVLPVRSLFTFCLRGNSSGWVPAGAEKQPPSSERKKEAMFV